MIQWLDGDIMGEAGKGDVVCRGGRMFNRILRFLEMERRKFLSYFTTFMKISHESECECRGFYGDNG